MYSVGIISRFVVVSLNRAIPSGSAELIIGQIPTEYAGKSSGSEPSSAYRRRSLKEPYGIITRYGEGPHGPSPRNRGSSGPCTSISVFSRCRFFGGNPAIVRMIPALSFPRRPFRIKGRYPELCLCYIMRQPHQTLFSTLRKACGHSFILPIPCMHPFVSLEVLHKFHRKSPI